MDFEKTLREILNNFWLSLKSLPVILGAFGLAFLLLALVVVAVIFSAPTNPTGEFPTAILSIVPGPTSTLFVPTATSTRIPSVTADIPPSPMPGMIGVGAFVQIYGTEGAGLNIRAGAGLSNDINFVAYDAEVFEVFSLFYFFTESDSIQFGHHDIEKN